MSGKIESEQGKPERPRPIATIWLFEDHLRLKASPTITYRSLLVLALGVVTLLTGANLAQVLEWIRQVFNLLAQ